MELYLSNEEKWKQERCFIRVVDTARFDLEKWRAVCWILNFYERILNW